MGVGGVCVWIGVWVGGGCVGGRVYYVGLFVCLFVCFLFCFVLFIWSKVLYYQILELYLINILVQVKPRLQAAIGLSIL